ncbi:MAG: sigma factor-like helix-turn-helix DNA-binding protein, partial [bacterium]
GLTERVVSVDIPIGYENDHFLVETLADEHVSDPEELVETEEMTTCITEWMNELSEKQREVICRRFGLLGHDVYTLEDVGKEIGLTR